MNSNEKNLKTALLDFLNNWKEECQQPESAPEPVKKKVYYIENGATEKREITKFPFYFKSLGENIKSCLKENQEIIYVADSCISLYKNNEEVIYIGKVSDKLTFLKKYNSTARDLDRFIASL